MSTVPDTSSLLDADYLHRRWKLFNQRHFSSLLSTPYITVGRAEQRYSGQFMRVPGSLSEIRINRVLLNSSNPQMDLENTLLHEMVHQYVEEVEGGDEWAHGPRFFAIANRVGAELNLPFCSQDRLGDWPDHADVMPPATHGIGTRLQPRAAHHTPTTKLFRQVLFRKFPGFIPGIPDRLTKAERWSLPWSP